MSFRSMVLPLKLACFLRQDLSRPLPKQLPPTSSKKAEMEATPSVEVILARYRPVCVDESLHGGPVASFHGTSFRGHPMFNLLENSLL